MLYLLPLLFYTSAIYSQENSLLGKYKEGTYLQERDNTLSVYEEDLLSNYTGIYSNYELSGEMEANKDYEPFSVIPPDNRKPIETTEVFPGSAVVQILIEKVNGYKTTCSGSIIAKDFVLTAAHCIHSGTINGDFHKKILVIPGRNKETAPFGRCGVAEKFLHDSWTNSENYKSARFYDIGMLKLDCEVGYRTGWYGFQVLESTSINEIAQLQGYMSDKLPPGVQFQSEGSIKTIHGKEGPNIQGAKGFYDNDTIGGSSGAPVVMKNKPKVIIGVHTSGLHGKEYPWSNYNSFTILNNDFYSLILEWIGV